MFRDFHLEKMTLKNLQHILPPATQACKLKCEIQYSTQCEPAKTMGMSSKGLPQLHNMLEPIAPKPLFGLNPLS